MRFGQENLAKGVLAGMAKAALAQDDLDAVSQYTVEILSYLEGEGSLDETWEPSRIYLTCYQALKALQDSRASAILETPHQRLQQQASKISGMAMHRQLLDNVRWNREFIAIYRKFFSRP